ncbi:MAG TPA: hypothetical protein VGK99_07145 [Acidobacteriota bacterium]
MKALVLRWLCVLVVQVLAQPSATTGANVTGISIDPPGDSDCGKDSGPTKKPLLPPMIPNFF